MKVSSQISLIVVAALVSLSLGCTTTKGPPTPAPRQEAETNGQYLSNGPTVKADGFPEWQVQTLKELAEMTAKYDQEKTKRIESEQEIERLTSEIERAGKKHEKTAAAMAASQTRIEELETKLGTAEDELESLQRELSKAKKYLITARTKLERETERAKQFELKAIAEEAERVKVETKLVELQIQLLNRGGQKPAPDAKPE